MKFVIHNDSKNENVVLIPPGGLDDRCFSGVIPEDHLLVTYGEKDGYKGWLKWFEKSGYPYEKVILKGYGHCRYFAENPKEYVKRVYRL